jgi:hypothetical protein
MLLYRMIGRRSLDGRRYDDVDAWFLAHESIKNISLNTFRIMCGKDALRGMR